MVGTVSRRYFRPSSALVGRLSWLTVLVGVLVQLFVGVALAAESRILDQSTCEDTSAWSGGSLIDEGSWDAGSSTCSADWAIVQQGDALTIPAGVTLNLASGEDLQIYDGAQVTNNGEIVAGGTVEVSGVSGQPARLVNNGKVTAEGFFVYDRAEVTNNGEVVAGQVDLQEDASLVNHDMITAYFFTVGEGSSVDNYGEANATDFWLESDSTFLIRCGAVLNAAQVNGDDDSIPTTNPAYRDPTYEECAPSTTEPATTTTAPPATTEPATTTTVVEVAAEEILPKTGTEDAGMQGLVALALVVAGMVILASTAQVTRSED